MRIIVIRQDEFDVLVAVQIPEGSNGEKVFEDWASDPSIREHLDEDSLAEAYWEELEVVKLT